MIVVFIVVLVVFGPQKLPELARSLGKLMAEFRKASTDFKSAFEEEMRDLERQARVAELRKQTAESNALAAEAEAKTRGLAEPGVAMTGPTPSENSISTAGIEPLPHEAPDYPTNDGPVIKPVSEAVARLDAPAGESGAEVAAPKEDSNSSETPTSHDQQQPA